MATQIINQSFLSLFCILYIVPPLVIAQDRIAELAGDGAVLMRSPTGGSLYSLNIHAPLIPASIVKLPLSHAALSLLGDEFRFETQFYTNDNDDLLIKGLGDPFLVSEEIASIATILAQRGVKQIRRLIVDNSAFEPNPDLPLESGANDPHAARNSALAVNFNTVNLAWTENGELISGEDQTPLTEAARQIGADLQAGEPQRINLGDNPLTGLTQVQQVFRFFLEEAGITVSDSGFYSEPVTENWSLMYSHHSTRSLNEILSDMLQYSNNFIANQLFLTLGAYVNGYPATTESALAALHAQFSALYGEGFGDRPEMFLMLEGSGLGRDQRTTANAMMKILESFVTYAELLTETNGVLRKSGTLTHVYNFVGYIPGNEGLYPFVILTNQVSNNRAAILRELVRIVDAQP